MIWNADKTFRVEPSMIQHRHKLTPYSRQTLSGVVEETYLRGRKVYDRGQFSEKTLGRLLKRGEA